MASHRPLVYVAIALFVIAVIIAVVNVVRYETISEWNIIVIAILVILGIIAYACRNRV